MTELFEVLGNPVRIRIIWILNHEICAGELAERLDMTQSARGCQVIATKKMRLLAIKMAKNCMFLYNIQLS